MIVNYRIDIDLDENEIRRIIASYFAEKTGHKEIKPDDVYIRVSEPRFGDENVKYISVNVKCNCSVEV